MAWLIYQASALGALLSPLHGRFPLDLYERAQVEATELTNEKVPLLSRS